MTLTPGTSHQDAQAQHDHESKRDIIMPFVLGIAVLVLLVVLAYALSSAAQLSLVSDFLVTVLVLCPLAICTLPFVLLFVILAAGMNGVHGWSGRQLGKVSMASDRLNARIDQTMDTLGKKSIDFGVKVAPVEHTLYRIFEAPTEQEGNHDQSAAPKHP